MLKQTTDPFLTYYYKLTQSNYLHYGYWNLKDELTVENLRRAQVRYIEFLTTLIPERVRLILDVGCGIGGNALHLSKAGFEVESLSPDPFQQEMFVARDRVPFYLTKFEDFTTQQKYDLILMSESAQYIPIKAGFEKSRHLLKKNGFLLVSDYFLRHNLKAGSVLAASTHLNAQYLQIASEFNFKLIKSEDITLEVLPTLDLAKLKYNEYVEPTLELLDQLIQARIPSLYKILKRFAKPQLAQLAQQLQLIDSQQFLKYRQYMIYLFQTR